MIAWTLEGLGRVSYLDGGIRKAVEYFKEGITLFNSLGDKASVVFILRRLGMAARSEGDHPRAACLLGAFTALQEAITGHNASNRMEHSPELEASFAECRDDYAKEWIRGHAMGFEQAVEYALEDSKNA